MPRRPTNELPRSIWWVFAALDSTLHSIQLRPVPLERFESPCSRLVVRAVNQGPAKPLPPPPPPRLAPLSAKRLARSTGEIAESHYQGLVQTGSRLITGRAPRLLVGEPDRQSVEYFLTEHLLRVGDFLELASLCSPPRRRPWRSPARHVARTICSKTERPPNGHKKTRPSRQEAPTGIFPEPLPHQPIDLLDLLGPTATLVCCADRAEEIKKVYGLVGERFGEEYL